MQPWLIAGIAFLVFIAAIVGITWGQSIGSKRGREVGFEDGYRRGWSDGDQKRPPAV